MEKMRPVPLSDAEETDCPSDAEQVHGWQDGKAGSECGGAQFRPHHDNSEPLIKSRKLCFSS